MTNTLIRSPISDTMQYLFDVGQNNALRIHHVVTNGRISFFCMAR